MSDAALRATLDRLLARRARRRVRVASVARRRSACQTSASLDDLDIELADGRSLSLLFKNVGLEAMGEEARRTKPMFLYDPVREIETYRRILAPRGLGPTCYGAVADGATGRYWLFLERVRGRELWQVGELSVWQRVAAWLADMHRTFTWSRVPALATRVHAIAYDANLYQRWLVRALRAVQGPGVVTTCAAAEFAWLASLHRRVVQRLVTLPTTFIHGEFYPSNVIVEQEGTPPRVCPVDWEMAAVGPGLFDLVGLTAGSWSEAERSAIAAAYYERLDPRPEWKEFMTDLACCRVQAALQWVGWFGHQRPPPEHARDWLADALVAARELGW